VDQKLPSRTVLPTAAEPGAATVGCEMIGQVDAVVEAALGEMPPVPAADPAAKSQTKDVN
jgi:hypothetical protein